MYMLVYMETIKKRLGKRIKDLRIKQNLSQQELAELAKIDQRSLSHIECGDTFPSKSLQNISNALKIDLKDLFDFDYVELTTDKMLEYLTENIKELPKETLVIIYRLVKSLR